MDTPFSLPADYTPPRKEVIGDATLYLGDRRTILPTLGHVDAVVTDPPYGIGADTAAFDAAMSRVKAEGKSKAGRGWKLYQKTEWDTERPPTSLFYLMREISRHQIIWGGNYFTDILPPTMQWLIWDKGQREFSLADCEMAWSSQNRAARCIDFPRAKALQDGKEHPTQKPIEVMKWCIGLLPSDIETVCDPFMGSGTTGVACANLGLKFVGIEVSETYFDIACRRIETAYKQSDLFIAPPAPAKQEALL